MKAAAVSAVILVGFVIFVIWDIFLATDDVPGNTLSNVSKGMSYVTTAFPWVCGVLGGHIWHWPKDFDPIIAVPGNFFLLGWLTFVVILLGVGVTRVGSSVPPMLVLQAGILTGSFLWPT